MRLKVLAGLWVGLAPVIFLSDLAFSQEPTTRRFVEGYLFNKTTGTPLQNADVRAQFNQCLGSTVDDPRHCLIVPGSRTRTDENGFFRLTLATRSNVLSNELTASCWVLSSADARRAGASGDRETPIRVGHVADTSISLAGAENLEGGEVLRRDGYIAASRRRSFSFCGLPLTPDFLDPRIPR